MAEAPEDARPPRDVRVIAAVVERGGRFLVGRRPARKRHGGLWEFPGGKVREGESTVRAVRRELAEELALEVTSVGRTLYTRRDEGSPFVIDFVRVSVRGEPRSVEHDGIGWFDVAELAEMALAPADAAFVERLRAPVSGEDPPPPP